jgi:hypothetical protein
VIVDDPQTKAEIETPFAGYEHALISSDVVALDQFFVGSNAAMRPSAQEKADRELRP